MLRISHGWVRTAALAAAVAVTVISAPMSRAAGTPAPRVAAARTAHAATASLSSCTSAVCTYSLGVNPGLLAGKPFACPAIQHAVGTVTILNRFATHQQADTMTVSVRGLPRNTEFDLFTVQNSPLDSGAFPGFGFGWYQSDLDSNGYG